MKKYDEHGKKVGKVFIYSFITLELFFIILTLVYGGTSMGGYVLETIFVFFFSLVISALYGGARRGMQIGEIIEAKHKEITKEESEKESEYLEILKQRYAKGEITKRQFKEMKKDIAE